METIDYSRFRFRIGDAVLQQKGEYKIIGYYFSNKFNDYSKYGYVIDIGKNKGHDGNGHAYSDTETKLKFKNNNAFLIFEREVESPNHTKIDYSKFRFRIGDKILYRGKQHTILAYYFSNGFNNYDDNYGYTVDKPLHNGSSYSYNEEGHHMAFKENSASYIKESDTNPISKDTGMPMKSSDNLWQYVKPGDKVRVKTISGKSYDYQFSFIEDMQELSGEVFTISSINVCLHDRSKYPANYKIKLEENSWTWSDAMLEIVEMQNPPESLQKTESPVIIKKAKSILNSIFKKEEITVNIKITKQKPNLKFNF